MDAIRTHGVVRHGELRLPAVDVRSYSLPLKAGHAFLGDLASGSQFRKILRRERHRIESRGRPPFGHDRTHRIDGDALDAALQERRTSDEGEVVDNVIAAFSQHLADVLLQFLETADWEGTERIVCGGGLMEGLVGAELVQRTARLLQEEGVATELRRLYHAPDEAGMIGWVHAARPRHVEGGDGFVAVDIGGTNVRWSVVKLDRAADGAVSPRVVHHDKWCHGEEQTDRESVVDRVSEGIRAMMRRAGADGMRLCPLVGVSCPGIVRPDGFLAGGGQNLPGEWSDRAFSLPREIAARLDDRGDAPSVVLLHNDAVIQALSELPRMRDVTRWAAVTLGTGFGNCSFRNRPADDAGEPDPGG